MGEYSKRIGEIGEQIVNDFLILIGWNNIQRNFDIPSVNPDKHGKNSHGIDGYFHYKSPVISNTLENILISSKFSNEKYKNDPVKTFKEYYTDLAIAIESFKKSELRNKTMNHHNAIDTAFDRGLLFWLNNDSEDNADLLLKLQRIEIPKGFNHDGIILMDNKRVEFLYDAITYVRFKNPDASVEFSYYNTGLNSDDQQAKNGPLMPVQYLTSQVLPFRVQKSNNQTALVICCRENFDQDELIKLMGLAKNIGTNLQTNTIIAFPDYNRTNHEQIVSNVIQAFDEPSFTNHLSIENFNLNFRN